MPVAPFRLLSRKDVGGIDRPLARLGSGGRSYHRFAPSWHSPYPDHVLFPIPASTFRFGCGSFRLWVRSRISFCRKRYRGLILSAGRHFRKTGIDLSCGNTGGGFTLGTRRDGVEDACLAEVRNGFPGFDEKKYRVFLFLKIKAYLCSPFCAM